MNGIVSNWLDLCPRVNKSNQSVAAGVKPFLIDAMRFLCALPQCKGVQLLARGFKSIASFAKF